MHAFSKLNTITIPAFRNLPALVQNTFGNWGEVFALELHLRLPNAKWQWDLFRLHRICIIIISNNQIFMGGNSIRLSKFEHLWLLLNVISIHRIRKKVFLLNRSSFNVCNCFATIIYLQSVLDSPFITALLLYYVAYYHRQNLLQMLYF